MNQQATSVRPKSPIAGVKRRNEVVKAKVASASVRRTTAPGLVPRTTARAPDAAIAGEQERTMQHLMARVATLERLMQTAVVPDSGVVRNDTADSIQRLRDSVDAKLSISSPCAVVSHGDDRMLLLGGRPAWHFPGYEDGRYAGYHPGDDQAAIAHLEYVRSLGADTLLFPATQLWWLDHYREFALHLESHYPVVIDESCGKGYALERRRPDGDTPCRQLNGIVERIRERQAEPPSVLDLTDRGVGSRLAGCIAMTQKSSAPTLPYEKDTIDVVVVPRGDSPCLSEARRVASQAVVMLPDSSIDETSQDDGLVIDWQGEERGGLPSASIVIPTFNGADYMRRCLRAVLDTVPSSLEVEVIVADDCSTDETATVVNQWQIEDDRVRILQSSRNRGFIDTCNAAAKTAQGEMLVFLNNDTVPLDRWLSALLSTFVNHENVGVVGGKLIFPDGRLQEAGGVMFNDGAGANFGKWDPKPGGPIYSHLREVDYCSGALLATPTSLFRELEGFDTRFRPAYYEDSDYCFGVREHGLRVLYQPDSAIVHIEGGTSGTDLAVGPKSSQVLNQQRFVEKWSHRLQGRPDPPAHYDLSTWYRLAYSNGSHR